MFLVPCVYMQASVRCISVWFPPDATVPLTGLGSCARLRSMTAAEPVMRLCVAMAPVSVLETLMLAG